MSTDLSWAQTLVRMNHRVALRLSPQSSNSTTGRGALEFVTSSPATAKWWLVLYKEDKGFWGPEAGANVPGADPDLRNRWCWANTKQVSSQEASATNTCENSELLSGGADVVLCYVVPT